jgi:putative transposase
LSPCDNASFHDCRAVQEFLACHPGRIVLHYLPKYAPERNPIERIWWHLYETITRNHRRRTIDELLTDVYEWTDAHRDFYRQTLSFRKTYKLAA